MMGCVLITQVAFAKYADLQACTSALEGEIDQLVASRQLYGLSEDENGIIEGKA